MTTDDRSQAATPVALPVVWPQEVLDRLDRIERALVARVERDHFTTAQAAARLGLSEWTVRQACNTGRIRGEKPNGRSWRIPLAEVERVEREGGLGPSAE